MSIKNIIKLVVFIVVAELAGIIGAFFTTPAIAGWYQTLVKPAFSPPNWLFGPVWTLLYLMMGVAAYLIWTSTSDLRKRKKALIIFGLQLVLNTLWSIIFFGWQNPLWAFVEIILLWLAILWTILVFYKISRQAAYLLVPYIIWVSFASYLNFVIYLIN